MSKNWDKFYEQTKNRPPSSLLVRAIGFIENRIKALDLGAGALKDSRYLLEEGFKNVIAVDQEQIPAEILNQFADNKFEFICTAFINFQFLSDQYDLINAQYSLPFNEPESFNFVFEQIKSSLKRRGVFSGQLFGVKDEWNTKNQSMTFHTKEAVLQLFGNMEIIECTEVEKDGQLANGSRKHWHTFNIIARKI